MQSETQNAPQTYTAPATMSQNEYRAYLRMQIEHVIHNEGGITALIDWINDVEEKIIEYGQKPTNIEVTIDEVRKFIDENYPPAKTSRMVRHGIHSNAR